ncbi:alpha/beta fold hydrolase [Rhodanobacter sp. BL-MT-08]
MATINVNQDRSGEPVELFYEDVGSGAPVVLIHGWPVSQQMWENQILTLANKGFRVISYDRRGFGDSSKPWDGYDYDTLADDLKGLLTGLDLTGVTLVGFSMGGGEIARYMSRHGGERVSKVAFISAVTPFMLKTDDNPHGVDKSTFDGMVEGITKDRPDFLEAFAKGFFGVSALHHSVSSAVLDWNQSLALRASLKATLDCVRSFSETDFRDDLKKISVPTLIVHGKSDKTVPFEASGELTAKLIPSATLKAYDGAPHGLYITHKDKLNEDLLAFLGA